MAEKKIQLQKDFVKLVKLQNALSVILSLLVLIIYFSFIVIIGFKPELFSFTLNQTSLTFGIISGLSIIITSIMLTIFYVLVSNHKLDKIRNKILKNE
ncbi:MAG: hypothetical protein CMP41_03085 [Rickettsiales bacterium]|nr:hypothetical protein [Rickettsiales bacterium]